MMKKSSMMDLLKRASGWCELVQTMMWMGFLAPALNFQ